eukprot:jgi/Tetstr1/435538/TSEL_024442.t1
MDSAKTMLPHWVRIPKTVKPDMLLKYHLTCVKYDGYRPDDIYYYTNTTPHDSSTMCTLIWTTIMKAFSSTPEIAELSFSLDFSGWLRPHFQDHIHDVSKPHKFEFTRDDAAASGGSLRTALWSNTPLSEPVQILKNAPIGTPEIRAGQPLLYALCDKKKPDALRAENKEEVDDFLREHGQTVPAEARHTMATNADLNNAEAARVEAETKGGKKSVDTSWEKCLTLPWKIVEAIPLSYAKAIHDASGSREVFNEDGTMVRSGTVKASKS